ncbi:MAG: hypothetical protein ACE5GZ_06135 [Gammaproteobacteria bacterium]
MVKSTTWRIGPGFILGLLSLSFYACPDIAGAADFGRFFTTPLQRQRLDELRNTKPEPEIDIQENEIATEEEDKVESPPLNAITVKGIVYRDDGKSTAWVNNSNTFEGDIASQYIPVSEDNIHNNSIKFELPDNKTRISLKVGQTYSPADDKVTDVIDETNSVHSGPTK